MNPENLSWMFVATLAAGVREGRINFVVDLADGIENCSNSASLGRIGGRPREASAGEVLLALLAHPGEERPELDGEAL